MDVLERQKYEAEILHACRRAEEANNGNKRLKKAKQELKQKTRDLDWRLHELIGKNQEMENVGRLVVCKQMG